MLAAKARTLVADHLGIDSSGAGDDLRPGPFPGGAAVRARDSGWVLLDERAHRGLGPALAWAEREGVDRLHLLTEDRGAAGVLARRGGAFTRSPAVWVVVDRKLTPAEPAGFPAPIEPPAVAREVAGLLHDAGVEVTVEHGRIRGEVRGLEVARVAVDDDGSARVEVGVGRHDREAFTMVHGDLPTTEALASVVASVETHRRPDARAHPLRRLAPEGWLRWRLVEEPALVGLAELRPAEPTVARESVKDTAAAVAVGSTHAGETVVVACSVGIDLDVVPAGADARMAIAPDARLLVVVPERDDHPVTRRMAAALVHPAEVVALPGDWRDPDGGSPP